MIDESFGNGAINESLNTLLSPNKLISTMVNDSFNVPFSDNTTSNNTKVKMNINNINNNNNNNINNNSNNNSNYNSNNNSKVITSTNTSMTRINSNTSNVSTSRSQTIKSEMEWKESSKSNVEANSQDEEPNNLNEGVIEDKNISDVSDYEDEEERLRKKFMFESDPKVTMYFNQNQLKELISAKK